MVLGKKTSYCSTASAKSPDADEAVGNTVSGDGACQKLIPTKALAIFGGSDYADLLSALPQKF